MPPVVSIVGRSQSGKTTLIEKLIPEFKNRGYTIGTIKHSHHDPDIPRRTRRYTKIRAKLIIPPFVSFVGNNSYKISIS